MASTSSKAATLLGSTHLYPPNGQSASTKATPRQLLLKAIARLQARRLQIMHMVLTCSESSDSVKWLQHKCKTVVSSGTRRSLPPRQDLHVRQNLACRSALMRRSKLPRGTRALQAVRAADAASCTGRAASSKMTVPSGQGTLQAARCP